MINPPNTPFPQSLEVEIECAAPWVVRLGSHVCQLSDGSKLEGLADG